MTNTGSNYFSISNQHCSSGGSFRKQILFNSAGRYTNFLLQHFKTSTFAEQLDGNGATDTQAPTLQAFIGSIDARPHTHSHPLDSLVISKPDRESIVGAQGPIPTSDCLLQLSLNCKWSHKSSPVQSSWTRGTKDSHSVHPERREGGVSDVSSFSLCVFPSLSSICPPHFFSTFTRLFSVLRFAGVCRSEGGLFF